MYIYFETSLDSSSLHSDVISSIKMHSHLNPPGMRRWASYARTRPPRDGVRATARFTALQGLLEIKDTHRHGTLW